VLTFRVTSFLEPGRYTSSGTAWTSFDRLVDFLDLYCYNSDLTAGIVEKAGQDVKPSRQRSANLD
jgi:hypothetical protein